MSNKSDREAKEVENIFADRKFARQAWHSVGAAILRNPAAVPAKQYDKDGNETLASALQGYSYNKLCEDIKTLGEPDRKPTEIEMIMMGQIIKARFDTSAAVFVRDTLGARPVDESKVEQTNVNQFETMTDEELELLAKYREEQAKLKEAGENNEEK